MHKDQISAVTINTCIGHMFRIDRQTDQVTDRQFTHLAINKIAATDSYSKRMMVTKTQIDFMKLPWRDGETAILFVCLFYDHFFYNK